MITILLTRHADIDVPPPIGNLDPSLNANGVIRAHELARVAKLAGVTTIFTSDLKRTKETAAPIAAALNLVHAPAVVPQLATFAAGARAGLYGAVVLVVGHSNTVPTMIDALINEHAPIVIQGFDDLFVVSVAAGESQWIRLKYGA